ncbi:MAG: HD domain-containing protein [Bdellovibrionaceae bacterium]|nr:HD domain-containing protein [Pseudobdellovibrionaceae bacterium]
METTGYFKVRINSLIPDKQLPFNLYLRLNSKLTMYLRAGDKIQKEKLLLLNRKDTGESFFIPDSERAAFKAFVHSQIMSSELGVREKAMVLRESSMTLMEELYEHPDVNQALANSQPLIQDFIQFMDTNPHGMSELISLSSHDFYTYNHSLDVGIYSLGLADAVGFKGKELEDMGVAALFHDIGKRQISLDILCKKGGLNDAEWAQMQKHPQYGLAILNEMSNATDGVKAACFEHHESWAGNGYPQQLIGDEIHPFARIVALTDTYDAMTTQRSYNVPLAPIDAVTMMKEKLAGRYDPEMLKALYDVLFRLKKVA